MITSNASAMTRSACKFNPICHLRSTYWDVCSNYSHDWNHVITPKSVCVAEYQICCWCLILCWVCPAKRSSALGCQCHQPITVLCMWVMKIIIFCSYSLCIFLVLNHVRFSIVAKVLRNAISCKHLKFKYRSLSYTNIHSNINLWIVLHIFNLFWIFVYTISLLPSLIVLIILYILLKCYLLLT